MKLKKFGKKEFYLSIIFLFKTIMRRYCLSYDAKDSKKWKPDELKAKIATVLIATGATNLMSPTASTILFHDQEIKTSILNWNTIIMKELGNDIYYYLCLVAQYKENGKNIDKHQADKGLMKGFKELLDKL
jgi:hypothetical protein